MSIHKPLANFIRAPEVPPGIRHCARVAGGLLFAITLLVVSIAATQAADEPFSAEQVTAMHKQLGEIESRLDRQNYDEKSLRKWTTQIQALRTAAGSCVSAAEDALSGVENDLKVLGPTADGDSGESRQQRKELNTRKDDVSKLRARCRVIELRGAELTQRVDELLRQQITRRLLARSPSLLQLIRQTWDSPGSWNTVGEALQQSDSGTELLTRENLIELALYVTLALALGLFLRRRMLHNTIRPPSDASFSHRFHIALRVVTGRYVPHFAVAVAVAWYFHMASGDVDVTPLLTRIAYALPVLVLLIAGIRLFLAPFAPAEPIHGLPPAAARALARRFSVLLVLGGIGYLLFATLVSQAIPRHTLLLARDLYSAAIVLNLIWIVWIVGSIPGLRSTLALRTLLSLILMAALGAEWAGYDNLAVNVLRGITGTLASLGAAVLLGRLLRESFAGLDHGVHRWQQAVRRMLGLEHGEHIPGLWWLNAVAMLALWTLFLIIALRFWGLSETGLQRIGLLLTEGFAIGSVTVVPAKIALAVLGLALLLTISGWFRKRLEKNWLPKTRLDRGAREAAVAIVGYTGIALAVIISLVVAGFDFSNIAIIAGALSVGIGFGLQNIVNNFVSGLILLFERPVKTGDWVVVGGTEGYVKRISIRSTQIQTFDRADVIVPNSELISNQVTNWMLYDARGRVRVPVGVAYGSDTALVKEILLDIGRGHPNVVNDNSAPGPVVMFLGFGDSSLDFELRCFIQNIDTRLTVISDMNFAIDAAFREHNVEIPFPQRDVHVRNLPAGRGGQEPEG